jgi:hypothetical protein
LEAKSRTEEFEKLAVWPEKEYFEQVGAKKGVVAEEINSIFKKPSTLHEDKGTMPRGLLGNWPILPTSGSRYRSVNSFERHCFDKTAWLCSSCTGLSWKCFPVINHQALRGH